MASSSSSSTNQDSESIFNNDMNQSWTYDVFLSFCHKDTGDSFASYLYTSLKAAEIVVFRDDVKLRNQDQMITLTPSVLHAIEGSRISIIVFSKNYADSMLCLQELEKIMECSRAIDQMVVPVFYDVDPSDVCYHETMNGEAFKDLAQKISKKDESSYGNNISGFVVDSRNESEESDIFKVVDHVTNLLDRSDLFVADHPVGVDSHVLRFIAMLNSQQSKDTKLLGIWGMGGIGKTTLAKAAYNKIRHDFEAKSFLLNVREVWEQDNGEVSLQQRLLSDIYKTTKIKIDTAESGKVILQESLQQKRIFLVLDNVNKMEQLDAMCQSHNWFGEGSRIIITTRDFDILGRLGVDEIYRINEMDENESLELFCWHAFKQPNPIQGFVDLSKNVVEYCGGLPLALQVIVDN